MSEHLQHALAFAGAVLAAIGCAATGAYILRHFATTPGLVGGGAFIALALAIAFPTQLGKGAAALKANVILVVPVIVDALKGKDGGRRAGDAPKDDA